MIRVLIGDDHRIVREGLRQVLADAPEVQVLAEAQNGPQVLERVAALNGAAGLDIVLLDIAMPERDGLDVLQELRRRWPDLPVLMLSTYPERQYAGRCIQLGAAGYLNKSADADDMVAAVRKQWPPRWRAVLHAPGRKRYRTVNIRCSGCSRRDTA